MANKGSGQEFSYPELPVLDMPEGCQGKASLFVSPLEGRKQKSKIKIVAQMVCGGLSNGIKFQTFSDIVERQALEQDNYLNQVKNVAEVAVAGQCGVCGNKPRKLKAVE